MLKNAAICHTVISELVRHSVAEEMYVYPAMKKYLPDGDEAVDHDVEEHTELERTMKKLESVDARGPASAPGTWTRWSAAGSTTWSACATRPARPALTFRLGLPGVDRCAKRLLLDPRPRHLYLRSSPLDGRGILMGPRLQPALELLATVLSRPEPILVIAGFGRRDAAFLDQLPVILESYVRDRRLSEAPGVRVTKLND
jgi:hypothetical protein